MAYHGSELQGIVGLNGRYTVKGLFLKFASRNYSTFAKEIVIVSDYLAEYLPSLAKYHVILCGFNLDLFKSRNQKRARIELGLPVKKS